MTTTTVDTWDIDTAVQLNVKRLNNKKNATLDSQHTLQFNNNFKKIDYC